MGYGRCLVKNIAADYFDRQCISLFFGGNILVDFFMDSLVRKVGPFITTNNLLQTQY